MMISSSSAVVALLPHRSNPSMNFPKKKLPRIFPILRHGLQTGFGAPRKAFVMGTHRHEGGRRGIGSFGIGRAFTAFGTLFALFR